VYFFSIFCIFSNLLGEKIHGYQPSYTINLRKVSNDMEHHVPSLTFDTCIFAPLCLPMSAMQFVSHSQTSHTECGWHLTNQRSLLGLSNCNLSMSPEI